MNPSDQMTRFLQASATLYFAFLETDVLITLFYKAQQRYFDLNVKDKFLKNLNLKTNLGPRLFAFLDLVPDIVYRMIK